MGAVASACGSGASSAGPGITRLAAVNTAYRTTIGAHTASFTLTETAQSQSSSGSNASATVNGSGAVDFANRAFQLQINAPSGGSEQVLVTGGIGYVQVPPAAQSQVPGNKPWVSINLNEVDQAKAGRSYSQLASADSDSPTQLLSNLSSVSDNVTAVGSETVNGVWTTHYRATVDLNKESASVRAKDGAKAAAQITQEEKALGTGSIPVDVWVDGNHMVRQLRTEVPIPPASSGTPTGSGSATVTITFSNFGGSVAVTPPPPSEVADVTNQVIQGSD